MRRPRGPTLAYLAEPCSPLRSILLARKPLNLPASRDRPPQSFGDGLSRRPRRRRLHVRGHDSQIGAPGYPRQLTPGPGLIQRTHDGDKKRDGDQYNGGKTDYLQKIRPIFRVHRVARNPAVSPELRRVPIIEPDNQRQNSSASNKRNHRRLNRAQHSHGPPFGAD